MISQLRSMKKSGICFILVSLVPVLFFQNCGRVGLSRDLKSLDLLSVEGQIQNFRGQFCHQMSVQNDSKYNLSSFLVLNLTARNTLGENKSDSDLNGVADSEESTFFSPATVEISTQDSDEDGIPDFIEKLKGLNWNKADLQDDGTDQDGLENLDELQYGTDPFRADDTNLQILTSVQEDSIASLDCGLGQTSYSYKINKIPLVSTSDFVDPMNSTENSLSHSQDQNVILLVARLSSENINNKDIYISKTILLEKNKIINNVLGPKDFSLNFLGQSDCSDCDLGEYLSYKRVFAGTKHTCAITTDNRLRCFGANSSGQLGDGTTQDRLNPVFSKNVAYEVTEAALGLAHTCVLTRGHEVYCFGQNIYGQLGNNTTEDSFEPVKVDLPSEPISISAGSSFTCANLTQSIYCWGSNVNSLVPKAIDFSLNPKAGSAPYSSLSSQSNVSCTLTSNGSPLCWGGLNLCATPNLSIPTNPFECQPDMIDTSHPDFDVPIRFNRLFAVRQISVSTNFALTILPDNKGALCSGIRYLSDPNNLTSHSSFIEKTICGELPGWSQGIFDPVIATDFTTKVSNGNNHSCVLKLQKISATVAKNVVSCWGANDRGQTASSGGGDALPTPVAQVIEPTDVSSGPFHSCSIDKNGSLWCWGANDAGQLGNGVRIDSAPKFRPSEVKDEKYIGPQRIR